VLTRTRATRVRHQQPAEEREGQSGGRSQHTF